MWEAHLLVDLTALPVWAWLPLSVALFAVECAAIMVIRLAWRRIKARRRDRR